MEPFRFVIASLRHYRRIHLAVALGVAVATAVITGALLVGDSVRGSLRDLTLQRLGRIDSALASGQLFRAALADELSANGGFKRHFIAAEPVLLTSGSAQSGRGDDARRATGISIIGTRPGFWKFGGGGPEKPMGADEVVLTDALARELNVGPGDHVLLRIPKASAIPSDSPLGEKSDTSQSRQLRVAAVLAADGLARFALIPTQHSPANAFVALDTLQDLLDQPGKANTILVASSDANRASGEVAQQALQQALRPKAEDYGLRIEHVSTPTEYVQIASDQLVLPDAAIRATERAFASDELQPAVTYLANTLTKGDGGTLRKIPYSTITAVNSLAGVGPLLDESGKPIQLAADEIVLNRWAADDLEATAGDAITVTYYEPESSHGQLREHESPPQFKLRAVAELKTAGGKPTAAADPKLTPEMPGVTDQASINDWDLPFELVETIRQRDEDYWDEYRTTPKAFVSLETGKQLWASRWGSISLLRIPAGEATSVAEVEAQLLHEIDPPSLGMSFLPVKQQGLAAASGTTPFDFLFLGFSFFLMASAVMLIALLFQLGVEQRARELGTLAAVGVDQRGISRLLIREGLIVAAIGACLGVAAGIGYAWLMITGLRTWWLAAIGTPFLELHVTPAGGAFPQSLVMGWLVGLVVSWIAVRWTIRRLVRRPVNRLLSGTLACEPRARPTEKRQWPLWPILRVALLAVVVMVCFLGFRLEGEARAGTFFANGAVVLSLLLGEVRQRLRPSGTSTQSIPAFSLRKLAVQNTARHPGRSTLTVGLVATASFLIVSMSAFRLETGESGTGGFDLLATSDHPIHFDLNTPDGRMELGFSDEANDQLAAWRIYSLRVAAGEDASCLNLYRPAQPRVLGIPPSFIHRYGFDWAAPAEPRQSMFAAAGASQRPVNPWEFLNSELGVDKAGKPIVPVVIDASTAAYSLHLSGVGSQLQIRDGFDQPVTLEVVGLLKNSVLQGNLLISEQNFLRLYPETGGYRFFFLQHVAQSTAGPPREADAQRRGSPATTGPISNDSRGISQLLESTLAEDGFDAVDARQQLDQFLAVQNTYLSTFQSLGALGLLLGTIGLAVVQLRSVLERRGELALMRASGFRRGRLLRMVMLENILLLLGGLALGCIAAAVALVPQWLPREASVPWSVLALLLTIIAVVGLTAGWLASRSVLQAPILPALRGD
jgi:ABC-type antimicrobial peptide transport system permease subunit